MNYDEILKKLADKENVSVKEIENEMKVAINSAGLDCSVKDFIRITTVLLQEKTIYSSFV